MQKCTPFTRKNGDVYVGDFVDGTEHGHGTYTWTNGDRYEGEFSQGNKHGNGTLKDIPW